MILFTKLLNQCARKTTFLVFCMGKLKNWFTKSPCPQYILLMNWVQRFNYFPPLESFSRAQPVMVRDCSKLYALAVLKEPCGMPTIKLRSAVRKANILPAVYFF